MTQYYTSIEQAKQLYDLGLKPGTADLSFNKVIYEPNKIQFVLGLNTPISGDIPCWSVGALMDLIPKRIVKNNTEYSMCLQTLTHCYSLCHTDGRYLTTLGCQIIGKSLIDAVCQYVVWLIENGYINGNKPNN